MGADIPYEEAWDNLHDSAAAMIQNKDESTYRAPAKAKSSEGKDPFKKMNYTVIPDRKTGGDMTSIKTKNGEEVEGLGISYKVPDTDQKLMLTGVDIEGLPEGASKNVRVNNVFVTPDDRLFIKGNIDKKSILEAYQGNSKGKKDLMRALAGVSNELPWTEVKGAAKSDVQANVLAKEKPSTVYNYLNTGESGGSAPTQQTKSTSTSKEDLRKKYGY
jgi:hypothetical protein